MATKAVEEITINKIRIGGKAPTKIMKGSTEVKKVTKGSTVVYQKENVTYTLTGNNPQYTSSATAVTFTINTYKGSSTRVAISSSNISIVSGTGVKVQSVTATGTYSYYVVVNVPSGFYTSNTTIKISVTQPTSGQSITLSSTPATAYLTLNKLGFRFSGNFPSQQFELGVSTVILGSSGTHFENYWGTDTLGYYAISENCITNANSSSIDSVGNNTMGRNYIYYNNERQQGESSSAYTWGPRVKNGDTFSASFQFGQTWAGSSQWNGLTWYFHVKEFSNNYVKAVSSSKYWQTGVQPANHGVQSTFQNITVDKTVDLIVDFNWSWYSYWTNNT